ncbi:MetQ/NlpA family ABC transporter substrate-binding protein [Shinella sp.]|uniref:MetQ/NlpA family ABC transporter substrate-binding protein n=1 Tax=Shinella sp. TaxID=1870904 RepID=UPI0040357371
MTSPEDPLPTIKDVTENPKNLKIVELESALLPRALGEVDLAALNGNYVFEAKLDITKALLIDRGQDGYNVWSEYLVTRPETKGDARVAKLAKVLNSEETRKFIEERYKGQVVAAF